MTIATHGRNRPVYGGDVLPVRALDAIAGGSARGVDLIIGTNLDETALFGTDYTGIGPVVGVLAILALPPILTATAAGISGADSEAVHAARALGMTGNQIIGKVEWPLALPLVISGLRSATLQVVATATIAAYVSAGGLGRLLISGQATANYSEMFAGAVLVAALAILLDLLLGLIGWLAARRTNPGRAAEVAFAASR